MFNQTVDFATAWVLFPLAITVISYYFAVVLFEVLDMPRIESMMVPVGFSLFVVVGTFTTCVPRMAPASTFLVILMTAVGIRFDRLRLLVWAQLNRKALLGAFAVFVMVGLPVLATFSPTFAGWIKLDDGSSWLAFTDNLLKSGRDTSGLARSTYEATVQINLQGGTGPTGAPGYPIGVFVPLGVMAQILFIDPAWLLQPYLSWLVGVLFIVLFSVTSTLTKSRVMEFAVPLMASLSALLMGYVMWGGIKEAANVALLAAIAALATHYSSRVDDVNTVVVFAIPVSAYIAVFGPSGAAWVTPIILVTFLGARRSGKKLALKAFGIFTLITIVFCLPTLTTIRSLTALKALLSFASSSKDIGNLLGNLPFAQVSGIWLNGDFRYAPQFELVNVLLEAVVFVAAAIGVFTLWQRKQPQWCALILTLVALAALGTQGNAWIGGKSIAVASPFVLWAAGVGALRLRGMNLKREATVAMTAMAAGVLWSFGLIFHAVWLAPYQELAELEYIGATYGQDSSPALMLEYSPYAARHFLRTMDIQGAGELRRDLIPMRDGKGLIKAVHADIDEFPTSSLDPFATLVLRRSPTSSVPPSDFEQLWQGTYYDVWGRIADAPKVVDHVPYNSKDQASDTVKCTDLTSSLERVEANQILLGQPHIPALITELDRTTIPSNWIGSGGLLNLNSRGAVTFTVDVAESGDYQMWLKGWAKGMASILVDKSQVWEGARVMPQGGESTPVAVISLEPGVHEIELRYATPWWQPGTGGNTYSFTGLYLTPMVDAQAPVEITRANVSELCDRRWDWVEIVERTNGG